MSSLSNTAGWMIILVKILTDAKQKLLWKKGSTYIKKNLKEKHEMSDKRK